MTYLCVCNISDTDGFLEYGITTQLAIKHITRRFCCQITVYKSLYINIHQEDPTKIIEEFDHEKKEKKKTLNFLVLHFPSLSKKVFQRLQ